MLKILQDRGRRGPEICFFSSVLRFSTGTSSPSRLLLLLFLLFGGSSKNNSNGIIKIVLAVVDTGESSSSSLCPTLPLNVTMSSTVRKATVDSHENRNGTFEEVGTLRTMTVLEQVGCYFLASKSWCNDENECNGSFVAGNVWPPNYYHDGYYLNYNNNSSGNNNSSTTTTKFTMVEAGRSGQEELMEGFIEINEEIITMFRFVYTDIEQNVDATSWGATFVDGQDDTASSTEEEASCPMLETKWITPRSELLGLNGKGIANIVYPPAGNGYYDKLTILQQEGCTFTGLFGWMIAEDDVQYNLLPIVGTILASPPRKDDDDDTIDIVMVAAPHEFGNASYDGRFYATIYGSSSGRNATTMRFTEIGFSTDHDYAYVYDTIFLPMTQNTSSAYVNDYYDLEQESCVENSMHKYWTTIGSSSSSISNNNSSSSGSNYMYDVYIVQPNGTTATTGAVTTNFTINEQHNCTFVATRSFGPEFGQEEIGSAQMIGVITNIVPIIGDGDGKNDDVVIEFRMINVLGTDETYNNSKWTGETTGAINTRDKTMHWSSSGKTLDGDAMFVFQAQFVESDQDVVVPYYVGSTSSAPASNVDAAEATNSTTTAPATTSNDTTVAAAADAADNNNDDDDCNSIVDAICGMDDSKTMCDIVRNITAENKDLASIFSNDDNQFTIFVPDDEAFRLVETEFESLSSDEVGRIVLFHFYEDIKLSYEELACTEKLKSMNIYKDTSRTKCDDDDDDEDEDEYGDDYGEVDYVDDTTTKMRKYQKGNGNTKHGSLPLIVTKDNAACNAALHSIDHLMLPVYLKEFHNNNDDHDIDDQNASQWGFGGSF